MSLPLEIVDQVFAKLAIAYGHRFMSLYDGLPLEQVKMDWAEVLGGLNDKQLEYGLLNLPAGRAPDAREFRPICLRCPEPNRQLALPDLAKKPPPQEVREALAMLSKPQQDGLPPRVRWARSYIARFGGEGQRLTPLQKVFLKDARRIVERFENANQGAIEAAKAAAQAKVNAVLAQQAGEGVQA